jgi:hypothetical protein
MSHKDELEETTKNKIKKLDESIANIKDLAELAPLLSERKMEEELKLEAITIFPEGYLEEQRPNLLFLEREDEKKYDWMARLGETSELAHEFCNDTSGTVASYSGMAQDLVKIESGLVKPIEIVMESFVTLADIKSKKEEIPLILKNFEGDIQKKYQTVQDSLESAKIDLETISGASMNMRQFLSDLWGTIANEAIKRKPDEWKKRNIQRKMFRNKDHRILVSDCLSSNPIDREKLIQTLDGMYTLWGNLSDSNFGKNLLNIDTENFTASATQWLLLIDDLVRVIKF